MGSRPNPSPETQAILRVGFAQAPIDAPPGLPMGGYTRRSGVALGTAEPLLATAVVLLAGSRRCAVVSLDLVAVTTPVSRFLRNALSRFGLDDGLILAATHTHSGPGEDQRKLVADSLYYYPAVLEAIERAVVHAVEAAADAGGEAELEASDGLIEGIATSRVPGAATLPPTGSVVLARSTSGQLLGAIVGYAAHPTVLGEDNLYYSPDFVGPFRTALRRQLQGVPIVFLNGASGDLSTRSTRRARTLEENDRLGMALAAQFAPLVDAARPIRSTPLVDGSISFEVQARSFDSAAEVDRALAAARAQYRRAVDAGAPAAETRTAENDLIGAEARAGIAERARSARDGDLARDSNWGSGRPRRAGGAVQQTRQCDCETFAGLRSYDRHERRWPPGLHIALRYGACGALRGLLVVGHAGNRRAGGRRSQPGTLYGRDPRMKVSSARGGRCATMASAGRLPARGRSRHLSCCRGASALAGSGGWPPAH